jgi:transcriptional regulator with XRE-family HTH domain
VVGGDMVKNRLLEIRLQMGYKKQMDFADLLGMKKSYYNKLENNKAVLTVDTLFEIAIKLNKQITDIVYYEDDPQE